jgi:hypothetical protein
MGNPGKIKNYESTGIARASHLEWGLENPSCTVLMTGEEFYAYRKI